MSNMSTMSPKQKQQQLSEQQQQQHSKKRKQEYQHPSSTSTSTSTPTPILTLTKPPPSDEILLKAHNKISSSSTTIQEVKQIIKQYPQVLSYHVIDWGGSIVLHTVCSRQPNNYHLISFLIEEGIKKCKYKCNVNVGCEYEYECDRGGLVVKDYFNRTPLNILVSNNAIRTLRRLQVQTTMSAMTTMSTTNHNHVNNNDTSVPVPAPAPVPLTSISTTSSLIIPNDVIEYNLFNDVHSTYHVDMVRFLIQLNPQCLVKAKTNIQTNFENENENSIVNSNRYSNRYSNSNRLLLHYLCQRVLDCRFLLRIIPIIIEEGIRQQIGGEYGIGGLFTLDTDGENGSRAISRNTSASASASVNTSATSITISRRMTAAEVLIVKRNQDWNVLGPILRGIIDEYNVPILHGAIIVNHASYGDSYSKTFPQNHQHHQQHQHYQQHIVGICQYIPNSAFVQDSKGRLPIHIAASYNLRWEEDNMKDIVKANILGVKENDPITGLPVYALAAAVNTAVNVNANASLVGDEIKKSSLCSIYNLILLCIEDFT